jgi:tetratricopeptide (TPR) repeat protein
MKKEDKNPSSEELNNLLVLYQNGQLEDAANLATSITKKFPMNLFAWKVLGVALKNTGRVSQALVANQKTIMIDPQDAEAYNNMGNTLQKLSRPEDAESIYRQAIKLKPDFAEAHNNLGNALKDLGRLKEAEAIYKKAITLKKHYADAHNNLGGVLLDLGKLKEAGASYTQAIVLKPDFAEAHNNLGVTLQKLGRLEEAEAVYKQAIVLKPEFAEAHNNLGVTLQKLGRLEEAEAVSKRTIVLKSDFAEAHNNLGNTLQELGRLEEAEAVYKQAIVLKPGFAEAHNNLGNTLQELGRLKEAEASYKQVIALKPDFTEVHSNLALTLNTMGLKESALKHFERNLQLKRGVNSVNLNDKIFKAITKAKIDHDIEQFEYLAASGYDAKKFRELVSLYKTVSSEINCTLDTDISHLSYKHQCLLGNTYNRPIHILKAPSLDKSAIRDNLDASKITADYFKHEFGLTFIDDFLSPTTLNSLRKFLLGSTIWFDIFHPGGYIGAYLSEGLASPLILQIAEDLRKKLPKIFKNHRLTQLWAYKYDSRASKKNNSFTGIRAHADFAAVNVNFWITPKSANLDPSSGGLVVYNAEAPLEWDFKSYNNDEERIREEIVRCGQRKTIVPYNENRVVIFNSNLFHETDNIQFKDGYENRRINVTMLFGKREL